MMNVSNQSKNLPKVGAEVSQMGYGAIEGKGRIIEKPVLVACRIERLGGGKAKECRALLMKVNGE